MSKDTFYFSHDYNTRSDEKIKKLIRNHGMLGYGVFWSIIEDLYQNNNSLELDFDLLSYEYRINTDIVKSIVIDFGLFEFNDNTFCSISISNRLNIRNEKSNKAKIGAAAKWGNSENKLLRSERLKLAREKGTHTKIEWENMKSFFNECLMCGNNDNLVKDHIKPIYQGGSDSIDNIQPLCRSCNASKGSDSTDLRIDFCLRNACEMPATFEEMPAIKEKKVKEIKEKEIKVNDIEDRKLKFASTLKPFLDTYGRDTLLEFYEYWTEPNQSNTKFKQELQETWSLQRRLKRWTKSDFSKGKTISTGQPSKMESMVNSAKEALNMLQDEN